MIGDLRLMIDNDLNDNLGNRHSLKQVWAEDKLSMERFNSENSQIP